MPNYALWRVDQNQGSAHLATATKARAAKPDAAVRVRRVRAADMANVIALDAHVTKLPKSDYWTDVFRRYGKQRLHERFFLVAENLADRKNPRLLGFIIGEVRAWEFGSTPVSYTHLTLPTNREV